MKQHPVRAAVVDNRRSKGRNHPWFSQLGLDVVDHLDKLELPLTRERLLDAELIVALGGDGTNGWVIDQVMKAFREEEEMPSLLLLGGGSAETLFQSTYNMVQADVPEGLQQVFPRESFRAQRYRPPQIQLGGESFCCAYLVGFSHLVIEISRVREELATFPRLGSLVSKHIRAAYIASGVLSFGTLPNRVEPKAVFYTIDGKQSSASETHLASCSFSTLPRIANFKFRERVPEGRLRLLTIAANRESELYVKYALSLVIGGLFPGGPDLALRLRLAESRDVEQATIVPAPRRSPNACFDGELTTFRDEVVVVKRSLRELLVITPRKQRLHQGLPGFY